MGGEREGGSGGDGLDEREELRRVDLERCGGLRRVVRRVVVEIGIPSPRDRGSDKVVLLVSIIVV